MVAAACIINDGSSDDRFTDFRNWLIMQGYDAYRQALIDPDNLAALNILNPDFRMPEHCGGDRWSILHGDSLQIRRQFEPNSFDAIITDPPYASGGSGQTKTRTPVSYTHLDVYKRQEQSSFGDTLLRYCGQGQVYPYLLSRCVQ